MRILALMVVLMMGASPLSAVPSSNASLETTLEQCRRELQPNSPLELRRRASLVVGKYLEPEASELLGQCLKDEDAVVRRNALVSIGEEAFHLLQNHFGVLNCLHDPDVNIRRLASSLLDQILPMFSQAPGPGRKKVPEEPSCLDELLNDGLADEDAAVRRNVLSAVQDFKQLNGQVVAALLKDSSTDVVILAIRPYLISDATTDEMLQTLLPLAGHSEPAVRLALVDALATQPMPNLKELYWLLANDESAEIRAGAFTLLLQISPDNQNVLENARQLLMDGRASAESRQKILHAAHDLPEEIRWSFVEPLLGEEQPAVLRETAWRSVNLTKAETVDAHLPMERLLRDVVCESNLVVRRLQLSLLRRRRSAMSLDALKALQDSTFSDVRKAVFTLDAELPKEQRVELAVNGLMDEAADVRVVAIRQLSTLRPPDWRQLLCDSLEDSNPTIAAAAARVLLPFARGDADVAVALRGYLPRCADVDLRQQLLERLK